MKKLTWVLLGVLALAVVGCDNRSDSEKAMDKMKSDMKKASNDMNKAVQDM